MYRYDAAVVGSIVLGDGIFERPRVFGLQNFVEYFVHEEIVANVEVRVVDVGATRAEHAGISTHRRRLAILVDEKATI